MSKTDRKLVKEAEETLRVAEKVYDYRSDVLGQRQRENLFAAIDNARSVLRLKVRDEGTIRASIDRLETELKSSGGTYYPRSSLCENAEVFLVAAILAICIRMFFIQPFRIPTNSMYPTYNGMTFEVFAHPEDRPSAAMRPVRAILFGAFRIEPVAPESGEIIIPVVPSAYSKNGYAIRGMRVRARKWFGLLPTVNAQYAILVGGRQVPIQVPLDFQFSNVVWERFGSPTPDKITLSSGGIWLYHTGVAATEGQPAISFDVLLGDQLFVDRVSYHFVEPKIGDPIVFRTDNIPGMAESERGNYYIKRLVGKPGDTLQVKKPVLYRNGAPITGAEAFDLNANRVGEYEGYLPQITPNDLVALNTPYTVPADTYIGMGDNSDESADSRVWGPMPRSVLVGKALLIYYPFTKHVGLAK